MDFDNFFNGFFRAVEAIAMAIFAYVGWRLKQQGSKTIEIATDTNRDVKEVRHQTNAMTQQLVDETAIRFQLQGEQAGRQQERGTIDEREVERSNLQAQRETERAEDRAERQEMRESWQAHERAEGRRGLPDGEAHE